MYFIILRPSEYKLVQKYKFYGYTKIRKWKHGRLRIRYLIVKDVYIK